jgi:hypothetical protein
VRTHVFVRDVASSRLVSRTRAENIGIRTPDIIFVPSEAIQQFVVAIMKDDAKTMRVVYCSLNILMF